MTTDSSLGTRTASPWFAVSEVEYLPLLIGLILLSIPSVVSLGNQAWATSAGAHGPIIMATGLWLLHFDGLLKFPRTAQGTWKSALPFFISGLFIYVFGRAYDFLSLEIFGLFCAFLAFLIRLRGLSAVVSRPFPILYFSFIIPIPGWIIDRITAPLQQMVSHLATSLTAALGYPVAREGVAITVSQYQLLVEEACAGMNTIVGLTAISMLYIYLLRKASVKYAMVLFVLILPIAILTNLARVIALILITYHFGDQAAQSFLHATTGMIMFGVGLLLIFAIDYLGWRFVRQR